MYPLSRLLRPSAARPVQKAQKKRHQKPCSGPNSKELSQQTVGNQTKGLHRKDTRDIIAQKQTNPKRKMGRGEILL